MDYFTRDKSVTIEKFVPNVKVDFNVLGPFLNHLSGLNKIVTWEMHERRHLELGKK